MEDVGKDLGRRSSWIIEGGSKPIMNDTLLRRAEGAHTQREDYMKTDVVAQCKGNVTMKAETGVMHP